MNRLYTIIFLILSLPACAQESTAILPGALQMERYAHLIEGKNVGLVVNHTSLVGSAHLADTLLSLGINVKAVFAPEHGFRGSADAGEKILDGKDHRTGLPIYSLYGNQKKPTPQQLKDIDVLIFDIQDVGVRFYTYISTMHYVMEAGAENNIPLIILDRPNPNGAYIDGPILDPKLRSFVGMHPIPILHGLTVGELAGMINGEGWLEGSLQAEVTVIPVANYQHEMQYSLPVSPSPNLPTDQSIALYPSLCLFEGTVVSVGRGTERPFEWIGHPQYPDKSFSFTPESRPGATNPPWKDAKCFGTNLSQDNEVRGLSLRHLIHYYYALKGEGEFFNNFFDKLAGTPELKQQIKSGMSEEDIKATWEEDLEAYKMLRKKYIIYHWR